MRRDMAIPRQSFIELNRDPTSFDFAAGACQGCGVRVDPNYLGGGIQPLDEDRQVSSAAIDFEDSQPTADACRPGQT